MSIWSGKRVKAVEAELKALKSEIATLRAEIKQTAETQHKEANAELAKQIVQEWLFGAAGEEGIRE